MICTLTARLAIFLCNIFLMVNTSFLCSILVFINDFHSFANILCKTFCTSQKLATRLTEDSCIRRIRSKIAVSSSQIGIKRQIIGNQVVRKSVFY